jgi:hypothetical protein
VKKDISVNDNLNIKDTDDVRRWGLEQGDEISIDEAKQIIEVLDKIKNGELQIDSLNKDDELSEDDLEAVAAGCISTPILKYIFKLIKKIKG